MIERTLLTPAEAVLLMDPHGSSGLKCVQASLLSLVAAGHLAIHEEKRRFSVERSLVAEDAPIPAQQLPGHVMAVKHVVQVHAHAGRLEQGRIGHALQSAFDSSCRRYVHEHVAPGLVRRGLLTRTDTRVLRFFPRIVYERTAAGDRLAAPLLQLRAALEDIPELIRRDPDEALRIARRAGVLLLISPRARGQVGRLRKLLAERADGGDSGGGGGGGSSDGEEEASCEADYDFGDLSLAMEMDGLLGAIDAVGDCSGGDGGGDGGGGD